MPGRRTRARSSAAGNTNYCVKLPHEFLLADDEGRAMSWLMAAVYDGMMRGSEEACLGQWRAELLRELSGSVLEVGAGTGATLALYPKSVTRIVMCEPDPHMRRKLEERRGRETAVEISALSIQDLSFEDNSF